MNLRSIAVLLKEINPDELGVFNIKHVGGHPIYTGSGLNNFRKTIGKLADIPALSRFHHALFNETSLFKRVGDELEFTAIEFPKLQTASIALRHTIPALQETLYQLLGKESENTIYIRLPDSTDLKYITEAMRELNKILEQIIYHPKINGTITLAGWEKGSLWMEILLGTSIAATAVAHVVKSAAIAYRKILENKLISIQIEQIKAKAESLEDIKNGLKDHLDMLVEAEAHQIYDQLYADGTEPTNNEQIERLKHSIKTLAELMNKGAEVQPGLLLPPEIKTEFPDMKNVMSLTSSIKALKDGA